jgi:hypothetical protein
MFEDRERFAYRRATDTERLREPFFEERFPALEARVEDRLLDGGVGRFAIAASGRNGELIEHCVHAVPSHAVAGALFAEAERRPRRATAIESLLAGA